MSVSEELGKLGELHQRGVLSDDEFAQAKARVLGGGPAPRANQPASAINALRRSTEDRWLGGVCGGIARATGLATWVWRLIFALGTLCAGSGILLYILLWILVPEEPLYLSGPSDTAHAG
jgi:phage shock protein C